MAAHGGRRAAAALLAVNVVLARGSGGGRAEETQCDEGELAVLPKGKKEGRRGELGGEPKLRRQWRAVAVLGLCGLEGSSALPLIGKGGEG